VTKTLLIFITLFFTSNIYADPRLEADIKKLSKQNAFINSEGKEYKLDENIEKSKILLVVWSHGQLDGWGLKTENCKASWNKVPPILKNIEKTNINGLEIRLYRVCSGVRGMRQKELDIYNDNYNTDIGIESVFEFKDKSGVRLIDKETFVRKPMVIKMKVNELLSQGFKNIVLSGHSAGAWDSINIIANNPNLVDGVIALNPARHGKYAEAFKKNRVNKLWSQEREYKISLLNLNNLKQPILAYSHDGDDFSNPTTLSFLSKLDLVNFIDYSSSDCEGQIMTGGDHGISIDECFGNKVSRQNEITDYLKSINF